MGFTPRKALSGRGPLLVAALTAGALAGSTAAVLAAGGGDRVQPVTARLDIERAARTALKTVPGGRIEGLELDYNGRVLMWEADVLAGDGTSRELHIDARDGRVLSDRLDPPEEGEDGDDCDDAKPDDGASGPLDHATALRSARITASRAAQAALKEVPGTMSSVDFGYRRTAPAWEIDITAGNGREHKLWVDAATGEVITDAEFRADRDDG
ncbi:PepSY domain-containing protein [Spirillospora sp. CA-128828]|uniref:PepSY domain-containing protein n=1 Tax=Spirillospora sp. CA-128828 TaxID=3240033 RepID=UPI003D8F1563